SFRKRIFTTLTICLSTDSTNAHLCRPFTHAKDDDRPFSDYPHLGGPIWFMVHDRLLIQSCTAFATNSGPLSKRMQDGMPRRITRSLKAM
ncbi:MAG: hypothetical protein AAFY09_10935, partial [Pseudomonadota bacterium]